MSNSYNPILNYLETQEMKEYIEKVVQTILSENYSATKVSHTFISNFENISTSKPYRSINFDTIDGSLMQFNEKPMSSLIEKYSKQDIEANKNVYIEYNSLNRDVQDVNLYEKWYGVVSNANYSLSNKESYVDLINSFFSMLQKIEKLVITKDERNMQSLSNNKSISLVDWEETTRKYSHLTSSEIFKKVSMDSKLNLFVSTNEEYFIEVNYPLKERDIFNNTLVLSYYNKFDERPIVLATFSDLDYLSKDFKYKVKDNYELYGEKLITQINIDALVMILLKKRSIDEVQ